MIKKAPFVAVFIVISAIVMIIALGANDSKSSDNTLIKEAYATTKETDETPPTISEETTEKETESVNITDSSETTTVIETQQQTTSENNNVSQPQSDDLYYLAAAVCREAGGSSEEIQLLVANVVINRVNSSMYPNTVYGVLTEYRQYGMMWKNGVSFPSWANQDTIDHCYDVARRVLDGERFCPDNVLFQAEFPQGSGIYKQYDGFYFCYY